MRGVRVGEASHPGPARSRCFALTELDSDVEDEDSNSHISEVYPPERSGRKRLVILGVQTQEDPIDPTVLDEGLEVGSDHSSDTESIVSRGGTSGAEPRSCHFPRHQSQQFPFQSRDSPTVSKGWLKWIWKSFSNSVRV